jgi:hypothetical protein
VIDERRTGAQRFLADDLARLALGADKQDAALVRCQLAHELHSFLVHGQGLLEIDDVDLVAMAEDKRGHLGIPVTGLVPEVNSGFEHLTHGDRHELLL